MPTTLEEVNAKTTNSFAARLNRLEAAFTALRGGADSVLARSGQVTSGVAASNQDIGSPHVANAAAEQDLTASAVRPRLVASLEDQGINSDVKNDTADQDAGSEATDSNDSSPINAQGLKNRKNLFKIWSLLRNIMALLSGSKNGLDLVGKIIQELSKKRTDGKVKDEAKAEDAIAAQDDADTSADIEQSAGATSLEASEAHEGLELAQEPATSELEARPDQVATIEHEVSVMLRHLLANPDLFSKGLKLAMDQAAPTAEKPEANTPAASASSTVNPASKATMHFQYDRIASTMGRIPTNASMVEVLEDDLNAETGRVISESSEQRMLASARPKP